MAVTSRSREGRSPPRQGVRVAASLLVVALAFGLVIPRFASYEAAWRTIGEVSGVGVATLVLATAWNLLTYAFVQAEALPGLTIGQAFLSTQASTAAANSLPAGGAVGVGVTAALYRSWGFSSEEIARSVVVTTVWNSMVKLAMPLLAITVLALGGDRDLVAIGVLTATSLVLLLALLVALTRGSPRVDGVLLRLDGWYAGVRGRVSDRSAPAAGSAALVRRLRRGTRELVRHRWRQLSLAAVVSHLSLFALFAATAHAVGLLDVTLAEEFVAFSVVRVALLVPITPGGAGLAEVGLAGALAAAGADPSAAVGAVLLFRALSWLLPIPIGGLALAWIAAGRRRQGRGRLLREAVT